MLMHCRPRSVRHDASALSCAKLANRSESVRARRRHVELLLLARRAARLPHGGRISRRSLRIRSLSVFFFFFFFLSLQMRNVIFCSLRVFAPFFFGSNRLSKVAESKAQADDVSRVGSVRCEQTAVNEPTCDDSLLRSFGAQQRGSRQEHGLVERKRHLLAVHGDFQRFCAQNENEWIREREKKNHN
jgi:hypothetical protein